MSEHEHVDQGQPGTEQGFSEPTQPAPLDERTPDQGQPGTEQGFSEPTQPAPPPEAFERVPTTPADLPLTRGEQAAGDAAAAGYDAEPSEVYDPVAAYQGDGFPDAAPSGAQGNAEGVS